MGEMQVPADAYYGAQTARAVENFPISGLRFPRSFIRALGLIKKYAARVNADLNLLPREMADAIANAAVKIFRMRHLHFRCVWLSTQHPAPSIACRV